MWSSTQSNYSGDGENYMVFSSAMHKLIIIFNGGAIALLQVFTSQSSASTNVADRPATFLCFWFFFFVYAILRLSEVSLRNKPPICKLVGHLSHLFGALSALMLISIISTIFAFFAAPLCFLLFFIAMYISFPKLLVSAADVDDDTGATGDNVPPV